MKKIPILFGLALVAMTMTACMPREHGRDLPPGQYESNSLNVDSKGALRKTSTSTDVQYDQNGNKVVKINKKTSTDPKGLFNKSTTETNETTK